MDKLQFVGRLAGRDYANAIARSLWVRARYRTYHNKVIKKQFVRPLACTNTP